jgi:hypothetical protein
MSDLMAVASSDSAYSASLSSSLAVEDEEAMHFALDSIIADLETCGDLADPAESLSSMEARLCALRTPTKASAPDSLRSKFAQAQKLLADARGGGPAPNTKLTLPTNSAGEGVDQRRRQVSLRLQAVVSSCVEDSTMSSSIMSSVKDAGIISGDDFFRLTRHV